MARMPHRQRGVVLLITLIILVAMTLAGIGMMRSVDTGSVIAGNMAFKQATLLASDRGIGDAFNNALMSVVNTNNATKINGVLADKSILHFDNGQPCTNVPGATAAGCNVAGANINLPGYFSAPAVWSVGAGAYVPEPCQVTSGCNSQWWTVAANWNGAPPPVTVIDPANGATIATVSYLVHRMCQLPNATQTNAVTTLPAAGNQPGGVQLCQTEPINKRNVLGRFYTIFRITVRSVGTRNTVTYTQALAKIEML